MYFVLEGVSSCAFVYINAHYVGYTQGSHLQAEFDITDYVQPGENTLRLIGGCVWEWADHVITVDGVEKYAGDFPGEKTNSGNFCCDGMVFADLSFKAGTLEVKAAYQPIRTRYEDGVLWVYNRLDFTNLNEYTMIVQIEQDGKVTKEFCAVLDGAPHNWVQLPVPYTPVPCALGAHINCTLSKDGHVTHRPSIRSPVCPQKKVPAYAHRSQQRKQISCSAAKTLSTVLIVCMRAVHSKNTFPMCVLRSTATITVSSFLKSVIFALLQTHPLNAM